MDRRSRACAGGRLRRRSAIALPERGALAPASPTKPRSRTRRGTSAAGSRDRAAADTAYPTRRLQKGLLLLDGEQELAEEGVGFGVPVLKRGVADGLPRRRDAAERRGGGDPVREITAAFGWTSSSAWPRRAAAGAETARALRGQELAGRAAPPDPRRCAARSPPSPAPAARLRLGRRPSSRRRSARTCPSPTAFGMTAARSWSPST